MYIYTVKKYTAKKYRYVFGIDFERGAALASVREQRQLNIKTLSATRVCLKMKWKPTTTAAGSAVDVDCGNKQQQW